MVVFGEGTSKEVIKLNELIRLWLSADMISVLKNETESYSFSMHVEERSYENKASLFVCKSS